MRMLNPSLAVVSLLGFLTAASCTLITDVDRTKIPTDAGPSGGTGGGAGETGASGAGNGNESGAGAEGGTGGRGSGGTGGANAGTGGTSSGAGETGTGGTGGSSTPTETCDKASGRISIGVGTLISSGWTFKLGDGVNNSVTFVFDWLGDSATETGANVIEFSGEPTTAEWAVLITDAINNTASDLEITATTTATAPVSGGGGAGGESGAGAGGQSGEASPPAPKTETIELKSHLAGARGNVTITEKVGNPNFKVSGMSGGKAVICSSAASCSTDAECDADRSCSSAHVCD